MSQLISQLLINERNELEGRGQGKGTYSFGQRFRTIIYPGNELSFLRFIHPRNPSSPQMLHEFGESDPACGIHM
jgi:hypothetical protein